MKADDKRNKVVAEIVADLRGQMTNPPPVVLKSLLDVPEKQRQPMTREQSDLFVRCTLAEMQKDLPFTENDAQELKECGMILYHRLAWGGNIEISLPLALVTISLSKGLPGNLVMWAYTFLQMFKKKGSVLKVPDLAESFPWGFPTEEGEIEIWDSQKAYKHNLPGDNLLDQQQYWVHK